MDLIAKIKNGYDCKFGVPRQSGLVNLESTIIFEKKYRDENMIRGIEEFSYLWLLWGFSENTKESFSSTVRPPKLGGNERMGVFATRSPYRPNKIGLSSVRLDRVEKTKDNGTVLIVTGADLMNGTPIYDIKPYLSYTDCHVDATGGFTERANNTLLNVTFEKNLICDFKKQLTEVLKLDPRPQYQNDKDRIYSFEFMGHNIKFKVNNNTLTVIDIIS